MRRIILALGLLIGLAAAAFAQLNVFVQYNPITSSYTGPADISGWSTPHFWGGCTYAVSSAYALAGSKMCQLRNLSGTTQDFNSLTTGQFDSASAQSFGGIDATATCSTTGSSVTLVCTGASSTPHATDQITGTGVVAPAFLTACGTFVSNAGNCTMQVAQTISSTTITFRVGLTVQTVYDESGGAHNVTNATPGLQPVWLTDCGLNSLPCLYPRSAASQTLAGTISSHAQPNTYMFVAISECGGTLCNVMGTNGVTEAGYDEGGANIAHVYAGTFLTVSGVTDGTFHSVIGVMNGNGSSSTVNVDGSATTGAAGTTAVGTTFTFVSDPFGHYFNGPIFEGGLWENFAPNSTQQTNQQNLSATRY